MTFIYSHINMMAEMNPYLLFVFLVVGVLYAFHVAYCRQHYHNNTSHIQI